MNVKLIAFDLDGTALKNDGQLSERTITAFTKAMEKGVILIPTTGRVKSNLPKTLLSLPGWRYAVTSNGASVWDVKKDRIIASQHLDARTLAEMLERLEPLKLFYELYSGGSSHVLKSRVEKIEELGLPQDYVRALLTMRRPVSLFRHINTFLEINPVEKVFFPHIPAEKYEKAKAIMAEFPVLVSSSSADNLEVTDPVAHKGNGLQKICNYLGIESKHVMAIGDNCNDFEMLRFSNFRVAMGNATAKLKEMSDYVTFSNEEDGVAAAIEKFVLWEKAEEN